MGSLDRILTRKSEKTVQFPRPREAIVDRVEGGKLFVVLVNARETLFGPVSWQPVPGYGFPPAGTRCVVVFLGRGADRPWVVAFNGWPSPVAPDPAGWGFAPVGHSHH